MVDLTVEKRSETRVIDPEVFLHHGGGAADLPPGDAAETRREAATKRRLNPVGRVDIARPDRRGQVIKRRRHAVLPQPQIGEHRRRRLHLLHRFPSLRFFAI